MPREFKFEVIKSIAVLSENESSTGAVYSKELNLISYNDAEPVYDIRNWTKTAAGERRMGKGITLNIDELAELKDSLDDLEDLFFAE